MKHSHRHLSFSLFALTAVAMLFLADGAQTQTTTPTVPTLPKKVVIPPAKAASTAATPAKPVTAVSTTKTAVPTPVSTTTPATTATGQKATATSTAASPTTNTGWSPTKSSTPATSTAPSSSYASTGSPSYGSSSASGPRTPIAGQGVGSFLWPGGWTLIAYGCFRTDTRLFCDFDTTNQNNIQANNVIWSGAGGVNVVEDGGKITQRHNAFFVGTDGSQFDTAYISQQPVRFIIEYDDVSPNNNSISLVLVNNRINGVPIMQIDPSQPQGVFPSRGSARAVASGAPAAGSPANTTAGAANGMDKATQTVNSANDQKKKAQDFWNSVKSAVQSH